MRRRQKIHDNFLDLDTLVDAFIVLSILYGVPFLIGYYGCDLLFSGSAEDCKTWGYTFMIFTPIILYLLDRILHIIGIYSNKH